MKKLLVAFMLMPICTLAQKYTFPAELYQVSTIPDSMKMNANSVVRIEQTSFEILSPSRAVLTSNKLITLLNSQASDELDFVYFYDDFRSVSNIEIKVYDQFGAFDHKYTRKDMKDVSGAGGSTMVSDDRYLYVVIALPHYPASIEVSYKINYNGLMDYDDWAPQNSEQSVQNSSFSVIVPDAQTLRFKTKNSNVEPFITSLDHAKKYNWIIKGLKAFKPEEGSMSWARYPRINVSPSDFEIDNIKGDMSTWTNFGHFYYGLLSPQLNLSAQRQQEIRDMTQSLKTEREKIDFLYHYMQQNMRYVGIQLGIGGWRPLAASFVDSKKYGDCKALTNYMQALLQAVNIPSFPALINAGDNEERADPLFSNNSFNHVILMVPQLKDTVWLECTSTTALPGKLGTFTENRNALLVKPEGSYLQSTPASSASSNTLDVNSDIEISEDGSASALLTLTGTGEYRDDMIYYFARQKLDDQKMWLVKNLGLKQADEYSITHPEEIAGIKKATIKLKYGKLYEFAAGSKQFYSPRLQKIWKLSLPIDSARKSDYYLSCPLVKSDKTVFHLPPGFEPENLPVKIEKNTATGNYKSEFVYDREKNTITSIASIRIPNQKINVKMYNAARLFFDEVIKTESRRLIIKKKVG
jgi:transglutaminase-like putative cysteine protease